MASIAVRGKSLYIHYSVDGTLFRKPLKLKNNKQNMRLAQNKMYEIEEMIENNIMPTDEDLIIQRVVKQETTIKTISTLDFYINSYLQMESLTQRNKTNYESAYKQLKKCIDTNISLNSVNEFHYGTFKQHLIDEGLAYDTQRSYINLMNIIFNRAIKSKLYTNENPFVRLKRKDKKYIRIIPDKHFDLILNYLNEHNTELYRFIFFLRYTGFRMQEALSLTWEQIKFDENIITMTTFKDNNRNDLFPLNLENGKLKDFLLSFRKENGNVFKLNREWIRVPYQKAIEKINELKRIEDDKWVDIPKYTIHEIRKTFGSKYASKLMPIELMKLMRHADITTTLRYYVQMSITDIADKINNK